MMSLRKDTPVDGVTNNTLFAHRIDLKDDRFWESAVRLYGKRMEVVASNIANADTPNYKARDIDFKAALAQSLATPAEAKPSRSPRKESPDSNTPTLLYRVSAQPGVDGNSVDMDVERVVFTDAAIRYEFTMQKAVGEYKEISELFKNLTP
jgi:flagellar basal-body rod protein FlgB